MRQRRMHDYVCKNESKEMNAPVNTEKVKTPTQQLQRVRKKVVYSTVAMACMTPALLLTAGNRAPWYGDFIIAPSAILTCIVCLTFAFSYVRWKCPRCENRFFFNPRHSQFIKLPLSSIQECQHCGLEVEQTPITFKFKR